jgi:hypothetical protein
MAARPPAASPQRSSPALPPRSSYAFRTSPRQRSAPDVHLFEPTPVAVLRGTLTPEAMWNSTVESNYQELSC